MAQTEQSGTVGPIIFSDRTARQQLVTEGEVVTFRKEARTTGDTWWRESRLGPKEGDVQVAEIAEVHPWNDEALTKYREQSGFKSVDAWQQAIRNLNGSIPQKGYLYRVTLTE